MTRIVVKNNREEDDIQASVVDMLKVAEASGLLVEDLEWFAIPNGGKRDWRTAQTLKDTGTKAGVLDMQFICPTTRVPHFMEVKTAIGRLSDEQLKFIARCERTGVPWCVVRSRDDAQAALIEWGFLRAKKKELAMDG